MNKKFLRFRVLSIVSQRLTHAPLTTLVLYHILWEITMGKMTKYHMNIYTFLYNLTGARAFGRMGAKFVFGIYFSKIYRKFIILKFRPRGSGAAEQKRERLLTPLPVFSVWRCVQSWRENETAYDNRNSPIFPQDDDHIFQYQTISFARRCRSLGT